MKGGRIVLEMLKAQGVDVVFGLPGETTLGWYEAWRTFPDVRHVLTRDERSASYMAEAYAKATGRPGVFEMPSPGALHGAPGVIEAFKASVPVVFFTSDIPFNADKKNMLTGMEQNRVYEPITKESILVTRAADIPQLLRRAFRIATSGRPGPVHVRIPCDVFEEEAAVTAEDLYGQPEFSRFPAHRSVADPERIDEALDLLAKADRPVIICGQGALYSSAATELVALAEGLSIPVATTGTGKGAFPEGHALSIGVIGARGGTEFSNRFVAEADLVFYVGSNTDSAGTDGWKLPDPKSVRTLQLNVDAEDVGNTYPAEVVLIGDARATLRFMNERRTTRKISRSAPALEGMAERRDAARAALFEKGNPCSEGIFPMDIVKALMEKVPDESPIVIDPGVSSIYTTAFFRQARAGRQFFSNYSVGALGYACPASVGVAVAHPDRRVIAIGGDGSYGFNCAEMETMARLKLNITYILFNNDTFGWIRGETVLVHDFDPFATEFMPIDFLAIARGFGLTAFEAKDSCSLGDVLEKALSVEGPSFLRIPVLPQDRLVPPVPRWVSQAKDRGLPYVY